MLDMTLCWSMSQARVQASPIRRRTGPYQNQAAGTHITPQVIVLSRLR